MENLIKGLISLFDKVIAKYENSRVRRDLLAMCAYYKNKKKILSATVVLLI